VESYLAELQLVSQAVQAVSRQLSTRDALAVIVGSARTLVGARYAALGVPDDQGSFAEFVVAGMTQAQQRAVGPLPRQHGMLAALLTAGAPERLDDIRQDPRFGGWWPAAHPELTAFLGVPVKNGEEVLGIIFVANEQVPDKQVPDKQVPDKKPGTFTAADEELLTLFAAHAAIALTNARLYERSREVSVLEERARLARELHDAVSQQLFSIRLHARAAELLVARDPDRATAELAAIAELGAQAHGELRAVIDGLAPPELDGLAESLRRYAELAGRAHGLDVRLTAADVPELDPKVQAAAFRVAQEALHNALRHSGATDVSLTLSRARGRVVLEVADDGAGFDPGLAVPGLGLASMRDRAAAVGAMLRVTSAPGKGTRVRLTVPVSA
jgi:signal transduction histidine kinase